MTNSTVHLGELTEGVPSDLEDLARAASVSPPTASADQRDLWLEEIERIPSELLPAEGLRWRWALFPWLRAAHLIPSEPWFRAVVTSRNYPIVSQREQAVLTRASVLLVGLSTGRAVAQQLVRLGVGGLVLADADVIAPSNLNRMIGASLFDLGLPKPQSVARELLSFNPYSRVTSVVEFLDQRSAAGLIAEHSVSVVVEMIDNLDAKVGVRDAARAAGVPVVMATDMDWSPFVDIEEPHRPMFNGRLDAAEIEKLRDPAVDFGTKTELVMKFMALTEWAPRSALSGQLAKEGLIPYWSQTVPSAATAGALATRAVFDLLRGHTDLPVRAGVSLRDGFGTGDSIDTDEPLVRSLNAMRAER